jgi:chemotaxis protein MotB
MARNIRHRKKVLEDVNNHDRWMVSYADFITLLFAFFVVMYSISSVNEGKYRTLSLSLGTAFSNKQEKLLNPVRDKTSFTAVQPMLLDNPLIYRPIISLDNPAVIFKPVIPLGKPASTVKSILLDKPAATFKSISLDNPAEIFKPIPLDDPAKTFKPVPLDDPAKTFKPVPLDNPAAIFKSILLGNPAAIFKSILSDHQTTVEVEKKRELSEGILNERRQLNHVSDQLEKALGSFINAKLVSIKRNDYWIALEMNSELLFLSGEATLSKKAQLVLEKIAKVINPLPNAINIEGHTDDIPINTLKFPSNWDLSSARATSVVQEFVKAGVNPTRLSAIGYGEFHPIGNNKTEEGRFKNRRVTLVLMSQAFSRYGANDEERAKLLNLVPVADSDGTLINKP